MYQIINLKTINNSKIDLKDNNEILNMIINITQKYDFKYKTIISNFFKSRNLKDILKIECTSQKFHRHIYLSELSLTYILVYMDELLKELDNLYKRDEKFLELFLNNYLLDNKVALKKFIDLANNIINYDNYSNNLRSSVYTIVLREIVEGFYNGLEKTRFYYYIQFGNISNFSFPVFKSRVISVDHYNIIRRICMNLKDEEIIYFYKTRNQEIENLPQSDLLIMEQTINSLKANEKHIIIEPTKVTNKDRKQISEILNHLYNNIKEHPNFKIEKIEEINEIFKKESTEIFHIEVISDLLFMYTCKIRKRAGKIYFYIFAGDKIMYKDIIYYPEDIKRFLIIMDDLEKIRISNEYFWKKKIE